MNAAVQSRPIGQLDRPAPSLRIIEAVEPPTDADLYRRWIEGDRAAGGELYRRHEARLLRWLEWRAGSSDAAADVSQATWVAAFESRSFAGRGSFFGWLKRVAATRLARQRARQKLADRYQNEWPGQATPTSPSRAVLRVEATTALEDISHERIRETTRRWAEGAEPIDLAAESGESKFTIYKRIRLGTQRLQERLAR